MNFDGFFLMELKVYVPAPSKKKKLIFNSFQKKDNFRISNLKFVIIEVKEQKKMKKRKFDLLDFMSLIILIGIPLLCLYVFKLQLTTVFTIFALLLFLSILFDKKRKRG